MLMKTNYSLSELSEWKSLESSVDFSNLQIALEVLKERYFILEEITKSEFLSLTDNIIKTFTNYNYDYIN